MANFHLLLNTNGVWTPPDSTTGCYFGADLTIEAYKP